MLGWTLKNFFLRAAAVVAVFLSLGLIALSSAFSLQTILSKVNGAQAYSATYFINSPTCFAREKENLSLLDLPFVQGEKATYLVDKDEGQGFAQKALVALSARVLWTEEVDGVVSYYAYSDSLSKSVLVSGEKVNLHIAVKENRIVIGTPIIFGGY